MKDPNFKSWPSNPSTELQGLMYWVLMYWGLMYCIKQVQIWNDRSAVLLLHLRRCFHGHTYSSMAVCEWTVWSFLKTHPACTCCAIFTQLCAQNSTTSHLARMATLIIEACPMPLSHNEHQNWLTVLAQQKSLWRCTYNICLYIAPIYSPF